MVKKDFLLALGERSGTPVDTDELLKSKVAERKRKEIERQEELDDAKHEALMAKYRKDVKTSEKGEEKRGSEGPMKFEVKGGVNLGTIDLQQEREEARKELERMKKEADDAARATGQENQQLREKIHEKELEFLRMSFQAQIEVLGKMIEQNASKGNFTDQLNAARTIASELGYSQPAGGGGDLDAQIKLKEMEFNNQIAFRKLDEETKDRDFQRKLDMQRLEDERVARKEQATRDAKKDEMFSKAPEVVGRMIGRAIVEGGGAETEALVTSKGRMPGIEAGVGESGEAECIKCHQPVAIGPTARMAVCAECGARYPIKRVAVESQGYDSIAGQEPQTAQEELEE